MQYNWKLFIWKNGKTAERTELTQYLIEPIFLERRLNERLSSGEIVIDCLPVDIYRLPFMPKTKITLERWVAGQLDTYFDYCVDHDDVEYYAGCAEICCHRIYLIEPSVIAQGMHCDNFALTYELNDVTLEYKTVVASGAKVVKSIEQLGDIGGFERPINAISVNEHGWVYKRTFEGTLYYQNSYFYKWGDTNSIDNLLLNLNGLEQQTITFIIPALKCFANTENGAIELFDCPVRCRVIRTTLKNGATQVGTEQTIVNYLYNPGNSVQNRNDRFMYNLAGKAGIQNYPNENGSGSVGSDQNNVMLLFGSEKLSAFPALINTSAEPTSKTVTFLTSVLTPEDVTEKLSYKYYVQLNIEPYESGSFIRSYRKKCIKTVNIPEWWEILLSKTYEYAVTNESTITKIDTDALITLSFYATDLTTTIPTPFLLKGIPYNAFDLLRKAMLTCDTRIIDNTITGLDEQTDSTAIQYPIEPNAEWASKLKQTTIYESIFEQKNLWEVLLQIGYYLHAVPYLEFARNGEDKFILKFRQLGASSVEIKKSNKMTVFNSNTLDNFFTQYDSYVTNIYSPQNEVEEFLVVKTSDNTKLVSNNTAELQTKYNILEIVEFDITYNQVTKSALEYVFEQSIYDTLTSKTSFTPGKWSSLYYTLGTNKILGLNYVPPTVNNNGYMALKTIIAKLFTNGKPLDNFLFNLLEFRIKYRTHDSLRITQLRPDLTRFIKNSEFDNYPHHEQFYNPQDKIVDSERFSANLWGRLVRVANGIYQCQEYTVSGQEKEPGDLIAISGEAYYVTECENEYYNEAIFQKVTYSKDFNNLSNIVTIPSEPRFYEVSERSMVRREIRLLEFIKLDTKLETNNSPTFLNKATAAEFLSKLFFADGGNAQIPNFAYTNFKADNRRKHYGLQNNESTLLFPSSTTKNENGAIQPLPNSASKAVVVPALHFPLRNSLVIEWDMDDNFKAGDFVDSDTYGGVGDDSYYALQAARYCDLYGRADLMEFNLFYRTNNLSIENKREFPLPTIKPRIEDSQMHSPIQKSIALDKDNREALSFNYQLSLLYDNEFITFPNLFGNKKARLKVMLLKKAISKLSETLEFSQLEIISDNLVYAIKSVEAAIKIDFISPTGVDFSSLKSILFYDVENGGKIPYMARNVDGLTDKLQSWYIYPVYNT